MKTSRMSLGGLLLRFAGLYVALLVVSAGVALVLGPGLRPVTDLGALLGAVYLACAGFARGHGGTLTFGAQGRAFLGLLAVDLLISLLLTLAVAAASGLRIVPSSLLPGLGLMAALHGIPIAYMVRWVAVRLARQTREARVDEEETRATGQGRTAGDREGGSLMPGMFTGATKEADADQRRPIPTTRARFGSGALFGSKRHRLAATYRSMPTAELQRRITLGGLVPMALAAAKAELQGRTSAAAESTVAGTPDPATSETRAADEAATRKMAVYLSLSITAAAGLGWFLMPAGDFFLVLALLLPVILMPLGKAYPRAALALGILLAAAPVAVVATSWFKGRVFSQRGDYANLGHLVEAAFYLFLFTACWTVAATLISGARHRGSWQSLYEEIGDRADKATKALTRRRY